ncbi:MAG TPA: argininosuccinate lyase [Rhodospirillaceae bacterium]|nr:argininosuccinate lyase [Rhodospirillaceae bacterium]|tara:strand:- start:1089 stop:2606 length:1518 start_codon:yes stop_codon:yes gene_type:complete
MESKVSGMFEEGLDPVIQSAMLAPNLAREFIHVLPLITRINKAHVLMLADRGILAATTARPLAQAILALEDEGEGAFTLDPALEDPYFNYEAELIARTGTEIGGRVHTARSRNDLYATMDRLRARELADRFAAAVLDLRSTLIAKAKEHRDVLAPGYTHLQPAQPVTYGYFLAGFAQALERDFARLVECRARINVSPLGAGAMAGTSFPIDREATARWLGFDAVGLHAQDCIAARDFLAELLAAAGMTATTWGRLAQDLFVMTTYEFGTLELPDSVAQTSSMMPQKKNMSALEVLRASSAQIMGAHTTAMEGLKSAHYSFGFDSCCDAFRWAWDALDGAVRGAAVAGVVVGKARPRADRMADLVRVNFSTATDLADILVRDAQFSFRDAHHLVGAVVRAAMKRGMTADQITLPFIAEIADTAFGWQLDLDADAVVRAVDPAQAVQARRDTGGPSSHDLDRLFESLDASLGRDRRTLQTWAAAGKAAADSLDTAFDALAAGARSGA